MATVTSTRNGYWSETGMWSTAALPQDGDDVVIAAGHECFMNVDTSGMTGFLSVTVQGHATTPGQLYWQNGGSGYLKIRTGGVIQGTAGTLKGRILANSNGLWSTNTVLSNSNKAVILLTTTAYINARYLDIKLLCDNPTVRWTRVYGTKYDFTAGAGTVDLVNNTIDLGVTPPANDTRVVITTSGGTLPGGLEEEFVYYIRGVSGTKCKLAKYARDYDIVDLTSLGSGTCRILTGFGGGSATLNVLDDVTGDARWATSAYSNQVFISSTFSGDSNRVSQTTTLSTIGAASITVANTITGSYSPGARLYLVSRNVAIISSGANAGSDIIVFYDTSTTQNAILQCLIYNTASTNGTAGRAILSGNGTTLSGMLFNCYYTGYYVYNHNYTNDCIVLNCYIPDYSNTLTLANGIFDCCYYTIYNSVYTRSTTGRFHNNVYTIYNGIFAILYSTVRMCGNYIALSKMDNGHIYCDLLCGTYGLYYTSSNIYSDIIGMTSYGIFAGVNKLYNCILVSNNTDFGGPADIIGHNCSSLSAIQFSTASISDLTYTDLVHFFLYNYAGENGKITGWTRGGSILTEAAPSTPPITIPYAYKMIGSGSTNRVYLDIPITVEAGRLLRIQICERCSQVPSAFGLGPRFQLTVPGDYDFENSTQALVTKTAQIHGGDNTNWNIITLEYRPVYDQQIVLRSFCITNSYYYHWMYTMQNSSSVALQFRGV